MKKFFLLTLGSSIVLLCSFAMPKGGVQKTGKNSFEITDPSAISEADQNEIEEILSDYYGPQNLRSKSIVLKPWVHPDGIWLWRNKTWGAGKFVEFTVAGDKVIAYTPRDVAKVTAILNKYTK